VLTDGIVLRSQACLVASRKARTPADETLIAEISAMVAKAAGGSSA